ncbi:MAG: lysophospholipase [Desulfocapsaceae bacterium]
MQTLSPQIHTGAFYALQICVIVMLTACSPTFTAPLAPKAASPNISGQIFTSYDHTELPLRVWMPSRKPTGVIIAVHGFNDYSNFMKDTALSFNTHDLAVYAYDQRGFGETISRGRWSGWQSLVEDLSTFIALIKKTHPETPVYILGDSMGGAVTILTMAMEDAPEVNGLILVAPAVWARSEMPLYQRFLLSVAAHTIPWKKVTGGSLKITPSDNIEMLRELGQDPLVIKETRIDVLYGLSNLMDEAYDSAERLSNRLLLLYGEKDEIIPQEPVSSFYQRLPLMSQGLQQMILYEKGYHMLLRDLQADVVTQDIVDWLTDPAKLVLSP